MKRSVAALCAVAAILVAGFATTAKAEDVSASVLSQMGLGGMERLSDEQGMQVRGQGAAAVFGIGFASVILSNKLDMYEGFSGPRLNASASGDALSEATFKFSLNILGVEMVSLRAYAGAAGNAFAMGR